MFWGTMRLAVPLLVARRRETEVGTEVDDVTDAPDQRRHQLLGLTMRQRKKHEVEPIERGRLHGLVLEAWVRRRK